MVSSSGHCIRIGGSDTWVASVPLQQNDEDINKSPMALHFVLDNSASMGERTNEAKSVFSGLVDSASSGPCSLTLFADEGTLQSSNIMSSAQMLNLPRLSQGSTNIPAGVRTAMECIVLHEKKEEEKAARNNVPGAPKTHHLLVLLTDGDHNRGSRPEVEFPKIGEECLAVIPNVQLSVIVVGITRNSSTSMGMLLKTSLETVPLADVQNIFFAVDRHEMKAVMEKLVKDLECISTGKIRTVSNDHSNLIGEFGASLTDNLTVRTSPRDSDLTFLMESKEEPDHIFLDGNRMELVAGVEGCGVDFELVADAIGDHIDKIRIQRVASASPEKIRSAVSQLNALVDVLEKELSSKGKSGLALKKANGPERLKQHRAIHRTTQMARELRNQLADVANFTANSSEEQAAFLIGKQSKFASKALRRAAARSGGDVVLDPQKEMDKALVEITNDAFASELGALLRNDTIKHLARLSTDQLRRLMRHVDEASPSDAAKLRGILGLVEAFKEEETRSKNKPTEKVHTSALCWIPPPGKGHNAIQSIRQIHDRHIKRWPPHVNLLYPFVPVSEFEVAATKLAEALNGCDSFDVTLRKIDYFVQKSSCTAWLRPDETQALTELQAACQAAFPECDDLTSRGTYVPHLTVGQPKNKAAVEVLAHNAKWEPTKFHCGEICMISRKGPTEPFEVHWRIELGTGISKPGPGAPEPSSLENIDKRANRVTKKADIVAAAGPEAKEFLDSGILAGYLNDVFFGGRQSYLSLSSPWEHVAEWRDLYATNAKFKSQWEMLLYLGSVGYPVTIERSAAAQMDPFQLTIRNIHTTVIDTASLCCANHSGVDTYGPEGGEAIKDALVLVDPSCPQASARILSSALLGETFTSVVVSRDLHMYSGASMKVALLANALLRVLQPEPAFKSKADIVADIRREFLGSAYQCGSCGFGPVDHGGCSDLFAHHGEVDLVGGVASNACPSCGWFSNDLDDWDQWDGTVPDTLIEERTTQAGVFFTEKKPLQAKIGLMLRILYSFRKQFYQWDNPIKGFHQELAKKLLDWDTTISTQDGVDGITQVLIALMACDDDVIGDEKSIESAFAPPIVLAIVNEACAREARKKFRMMSGGDEAKSRDLAAKHVTRMLGITEESAPTTSDSLLESEPDRHVVEERCSRHYTFDWDSEHEDIDWANEIATRWCRALAIARSLRQSIVRRGGGWAKLENDMETSLDSYKDVVEFLQQGQHLPSFAEMCDIDPKAIQRTLVTMACQAYLCNKGALRDDLPDVRCGETLKLVALDMRMRIYAKRVQQKMARWTSEGQQLAFHKARACDIGQYEGMIGCQHVHGLSKEMFWGLWEAAIHDGHGGEKVRAFLETANEGFCQAHAPKHWTGKK